MYACLLVGLCLLPMAGCSGSKVSDSLLGGTPQDGDARPSVRDPNQIFVSGLVIKPDSTPVAGAFVRTDPVSENRISDDDGQFSFSLISAPGEYTFIATVEDPEYNESLEGRTTTVVAFGEQRGPVVIMIGKEQRMNLQDVNLRADPNRRPGDKRTGN